MLNMELDSHTQVSRIQVNDDKATFTPLVIPCLRLPLFPGQNRTDTSHLFIVMCISNAIPSRDVLASSDTVRTVQLYVPIGGCSNQVQQMLVHFSRLCMLQALYKKVLGLIEVDFFFLNFQIFLQFLIRCVMCVQIKSEFIVNKFIVSNFTFQFFHFRELNKCFPKIIRNVQTNFHIFLMCLFKV